MEQKKLWKLYFAHPINTYGTPLERAILDLLERKFGYHEIVNPSDQVHVNKVNELRAADPKANVMPYFVSLTDACHAIAVLPFGDGMWGAGVWSEAENILSRKGFVWVIDPVTLDGVYLDKLPEEKRLSVEDTRARIRNADGTPKPYN